MSAERFGKIISTTYVMSTDSMFAADKACPCEEFKDECPRNVLSLPETTLELDIDDIADSLMQVMRICGLKPWEVKRTKEIIKHSFRHYSELRFRIDRVPSKRFAKEHFMHDLAVKAGMSRMDAQLVFGIVKRAFRAYYHATGEGGRRLLSIATQMRHRSECVWRHAARKTAEIYAVYRGLLYSEQLQYQACIECVYKDLYSTLQSRLAYDDPEPCCECARPRSNVDIAKLKSVSTVTTTEIFFNQQPLAMSRAESNISIHLNYKQMKVNLDRTISRNVREYKASVNSMRSIASKNSIRVCDCRPLLCTRNPIKQRPAPEISAECSQGPYTCRWLPYDEEDEPKHRVPCPPMEVICVPCEHEGIVCAEDCTCTCRVCTCAPIVSHEEEHLGEKLSQAGVEDHDTDYCWLAPFRDWPLGEPRYLKEPSVVYEGEEEMGEELSEEPFEPYVCTCTCKYKQRAKPHLFTYLMPFRTPPRQSSDPETPAPPPPEPRVPPCGISIAAYRCWTEPTPEEEEESSDQPKPVLLMSEPQGKVGDIHVDVTVKRQLGSMQAKAPPLTQAKNKPVKDNIAPLKLNMGRESKAVKPVVATPAGVKTAPPPAAQPTPQTTPQPAKPATPAAAAPAPPADDNLTKEDILDIIGLRFK
ncbi:CG13872 [Drosophila busckii]|uniref:CG13872 n=2 Tax=Drosophila busckii TaxID=30019 RepID=A0A0M4EIU0_DROBS|nr:CG13872 [Drosophila busckii]